MHMLRQAADVQYQAQDGTALHLLGRRYYPVSSRELTPEAFGAPSFGDSTEALEALFSEIQDGDTVRFSRLHDTTRPLYTSANNITFITSTPYTRAGIRGIAASVQLVTLGGFGAVWDGPMLVGDAASGSDGAGATVKGLRFERDDLSSDIDAYVIAGTFSNLNTCISAKGKNVKIRGSLFSTSLAGVVIEKNDENECRGHSISDNRFHSMGGLGAAAKCIVFPDNAFDTMVTGNHADSVYTFYEGPVNNSGIDSNKIFKCAAEGITIIDQDAGILSSLQVTGSISFNTVYKNSPSYILSSGISIRKLRDGRIHGNIVIGPRAHGIAMYSCTNNSVMGNSIVAPGYLADGDPAAFGIYGDDQATGNIFVANNVRSAGKVGTNGGVSVNASNKIEINTVDPLYTSNMYPRGAPTLGLV